MTLKRLWNMIRMSTLRNGKLRADYARVHHLYGHIGQNVMIQPRRLPLYAELILIHDNVKIASGVTFVTHDLINSVFQEMHPEIDFNENIGCIEIMDNVFIGANCTILPNVRIGPNAIVAAGTIVNKDVPEGSIVASSGFRIIGTFSELMEKRIHQSVERRDFENEHITKEIVSQAWEKYRDEHIKSGC